MRSRLSRTDIETAKKLLAGAGVKILTLEQLLVRFSDCFISVDAKTDAAVNPLVELIKKHKAENRVSPTSFNLRRSKRIGKLLGDRTLVGWCVHPLRVKLFSRLYRFQLARIKSAGIGVLHYPFKHLDSSLTKEAHKNNVQIWAWTVNKSSDIQKMISFGVDGVITDAAQQHKQTISIDDNITT